MRVEKNSVAGEKSILRRDLFFCSFLSFLYVPTFYYNYNHSIYFNSEIPFFLVPSCDGPSPVPLYSRVMIDLFVSSFLLVYVGRRTTIDFNATEKFIFNQYYKAFTIWSCLFVLLASWLDFYRKNIIYLKIPIYINKAGNGIKVILLNGISSYWKNQITSQSYALFVLFLPILSFITFTFKMNLVIRIGLMDCPTYIIVTF